MLNGKQSYGKDFALGFSLLMLISRFHSLCFPGCGLGGQLRNGCVVVASALCQPE